MYLKQNYKKFYTDKKTTTIMFARESTCIKTTKIQVYDERGKGFKIKRYGTKCLEKVAENLDFL